ncbi:hypothetical protein MGU_07519 [Metarhizium guizhouense ARSEF 977]|uniref:Uncharacterized protein n=1 Tax=Metarhizium guizhouense (strain ARSEF 977) TaxID=1276136 RepID=A0A0B4H688_METGA|nr:hypothetical protein MGU_07519 [Metarhizium guizhouense ARSEF 977]
MPKRRNSSDYSPCNNCKGDNDSDKWRTCNVLPGVRACTNCMVREIGSRCVFEDKVQGAGAPATTDNAYGGQIRRALRSGDASKATNTQSSTGPGVPVSGGTAKNDAGGQKARDLAGAAVSAGQRRGQTEGNAPPVADDEFHAEFNTPIVVEVDRRRRDSELMTVEQMEKEFKGF